MCYYFWGIRQCDRLIVEAMGFTWRFAAIVHQDTVEAE